MPDIMFPKPEKKKRDYKQLKSYQELQARKKLKPKKKYAVKNKPVKPGQECELGFSRCTGRAIEKHELKSGASFRSNCVRHGFNVNTCRNCHVDWEMNMTDEERLPIRQKKQLEVMQKKDWDIPTFIKVIGCNYL